MAIKVVVNLRGANRPGHGHRLHISLKSLLSKTEFQLMYEVPFYWHIGRLLRQFGDLAPQMLSKTKKHGGFIRNQLVFSIVVCQTPRFTPEMLRRQQFSRTSSSHDDQIPCIFNNLFWTGVH
jgi:hypothetical protein